MKIEDKAMIGWQRARGGFFADFCKTVYALEVGQSFVAPTLQPNYRTALAAFNHALNRTYISRRNGAGFRVGRIA